ncbi:thioesterase family protein [soil metagenome]
MARIKIDIIGNVLAIVLVKVRISDINYGNHVSNDAFVSIIHEARLQWLQQNNFTELDIAGTGLIMSDLAFEFKNEGFYGEEISIRLSAGELTSVSFELYYELFVVRNDVEILLANAKTGMVCFDYTIKKVAKIPTELKLLLLTT